MYFLLLNYVAGHTHPNTIPIAHSTTAPIARPYSLSTLDNLNVAGE